MATLWITEGQKLGYGPGQGGIAQVMQLPALDEQTITIAGTSDESEAFTAKTNLIRVYADTACHVVVGSAPTATTSALALPAGAIEYFGVTPGDKIAVIAGA